MSDSVRRTIRTVFQAVLSLAAAAPLLYSAVFSSDPAQATGALAVALGVAGAITRVMALPAVEDFLQRFVPWLSADEPVRLPEYTPRRALVDDEAEEAPFAEDEPDLDAHYVAGEPVPAPAEDEQA